LVRDGLLALAPNADLETTARVLEELCRRLEADDAEDAHRGGGEGGDDANSA
jgi:hypothetical protein